MFVFPKSVPKNVPKRKVLFGYFSFRLGSGGGRGDEKGDLCRRGSAPKHHVTHIKAQERSIITPLTDKA